MRADGTLIAAETRGSIHKVGGRGAGRARLQRLGSSGTSMREGQPIPIDLLRQQVRAEMG